MIKAIETFYKGYKFRSRLEARWAVAFDAMGVSWEYEPEGFVLPDGTRYLPDFRVIGRYDHFGGTRFTYWVEVKPDFQDMEKQRKFSDTGEVILTLAQPEFGQVGVAMHKSTERDIYIADMGEYAYFCTGDPGKNRADRVIYAARSARFEHGESC